MKKYKIGYTTGVFDLFHIVQEYKDKTPIIPYEERCKIVEAIRYVDKVVPQENRDKISAFNEHKFDVIFVGDDWKGSKVFEEVDSYMKSNGASGVCYIPYTQNVSSTILKDVLNKIYNEGK